MPSFSSTYLKLSCKLVEGVHTSQKIDKSCFKIVLLEGDISAREMWLLSSAGSPPRLATNRVSSTSLNTWLGPQQPAEARLPAKRTVMVIEALLHRNAPIV